MNQDQIIQWAREADEYANSQTDDPFDYKQIYDERFASLIRSAALDEAAGVCESEPERQRGDGVWAADQQACASAIRALKGTT